jgi:hypothetical protein
MHMTTGNGWGKSGRNDSAKIMLAKVRMVVRSLSGIGSSARIRSSFPFPFCLCLLYHPRTPETVDSWAELKLII